MMVDGKVQVESSKPQDELVFGDSLGVRVAPRGEVAVLRRADAIFEYFQGAQLVRIMLPSADARKMGMALIKAAEESEREAALKLGVLTEPAATVEECLAMLKELSEYAACASMGLERKGSDPTMCEQTRDWTEGLVELCGQAQQMLRRLPKDLVSAESTVSEM